MPESLTLGLTNLASPAVLAFALGVIAARLRSDLKVPDQVQQFLSLVLLLAIGLKGGVALRQSQVGDVAVPVLMAIALGILIPVLAYWSLRALTHLGGVDRGAIAAHYGSTSLVTFSAALVFMEVIGRSYEGYVTTLLTVLEIPGIIVGILLAQRHTGRKIPWGEALREVLTGKSVLLLVGGLVIGLITGPAGYVKVEPLMGGLFQGLLMVFLLEMGVVTGRRLGDVRTAGIGLVVFALCFPLVGGTLGVLAAWAAGMSSGGAALFGILCASASYIAAPAAVRLALPEANPAISLTASLGMTFPFNLIIGIPLIATMAQAIIGSGSA